jgi:hypothetical protein
MMHGPEQAQIALLEYIDDLEQHRPPVALSERLKRKLDNPTQAFLLHFRKWKR